jgi:hypothetical protein
MLVLDYRAFKLRHCCWRIKTQVAAAESGPSTASSEPRGPSAI